VMSTPTRAVLEVTSKEDGSPGLLKQAPRLCSNECW